MIVGVLALQGDFADHVQQLQALGVTARLVRTVNDCEGLDGLIIPGGESTVMRRLMQREGIDKLLRARRGKLPLWGTCAGAIILTDTEITPELSGLGLIDAKCCRNAYGAQRHSQVQQIDWQGQTTTVALIRAPKIIAYHPDLEVLATDKTEPLALYDPVHKVLVTTFHEEIFNKERLACQSFIDKLAGGA